MVLLNLFKSFFTGGIKGHTGQWAEDVLVRKLFPRKKKNGTYLDIGAYHPFVHSNTAFFWLKGWHGYNVDANPNTIKLFNEIRKKDINIWSAVIPHKDYINGIREIELTLPNTKDSKKGVAASGTCNSTLAKERGFTETTKVPTTSLPNIILNQKITDLDYLNIDVEGFDEAILKDLDFTCLKPKVISIEDYSKDLTEITKSEITKILTANGYAFMGRAGPTSIFQLVNLK